MNVAYIHVFIITFITIQELAVIKVAMPTACARRFAVAKPTFSGRRWFSMAIGLSQDFLDRLSIRLKSSGGSKMQATFTFTVAITQSDS